MSDQNELLSELNQLTKSHKKKCAQYSSFLDTFFKGKEIASKIEEIPYLPVRALKEFELKSIPEQDVYKIMRSSGTSGSYSKIFLDKETANLQTSVLIEITTEIFGKSRMPMLVIDSEATVKNRASFSARTAAINGFSMFARKRCFALNDDFSLNIPAIQGFLEENKDKKIIIFGFTSLIWQNFLMELEKRKQTLDLEDAVLLHGGGWKKLANLGVSNEAFKAKIEEIIQCSDVHNYYGMVEQTGSIFMECKHGRMHASKYSEILVRDTESFEIVKDGEEGLLQVISTLPKSYPGHSLLTEDLGKSWHGKKCPCGNSGAIVEVIGRVAEAEVRGCSDAYT